MVPQLDFRKTPLKAVSFTGASASVHGELSGSSFRGFPYTTRNLASISLGLPAMDAKLQIALEDAATAGGDIESPQTAAELTYEQQVAGLGSIGLRARSSGDWAATLGRAVEDIGFVNGSFNSNLDWSLDLEQAYPDVKGISPSLTFGATQDGVRVKGVVDADLTKSIHGSYAVSNTAGKYSPATLIHETRLTMARGPHTLEAEAAYNRDFAKIPFKGSVAYSVKVKPGTLQARLYHDSRYDVVAKAKYLQAGLSGQLGSKPRLSLELGL